ncbi:TetR/AcrR family transcriptional regulator [Kitasatospora sp. NPDC059571]|uniref:TetR/AcrR family transcriptional regulator n=1 Tax=Kitasatospora sp. NPDC059571 TaxID=3346871 RepID=UPI0036A006AD
MGLRELKKQQTRTAIADIATGLFAEHGFDRVTVAEVARAAGVAVNTVFNYFPAKEDLFFDRQDEVTGHLARVVRTRPAGTSAARAIGADLVAALERGEPTLGLGAEARVFWSVVAGSAALRARALEIGEAAEAALAAELAAEAAAGPDGAYPRALAGALAGAHRALLAEIRRRVVAGDPPEDVRRAVAAAARAAFDRLDAAFGDTGSGDGASTGAGS